MDRPTAFGLELRSTSPAAIGSFIASVAAAHVNKLGSSSLGHNISHYTTSNRVLGAEYTHLATKGPKLTQLISVQLALRRHVLHSTHY
jgi:hypothetical protein